MITKNDKELFEKSIIAQDDDCDWSESGYVAVVVGNWAALSKYSHCSCFGTWDWLCDSNVMWDWQGTPQKLVSLAKKKMDPCMPDRKADINDYDYDHLEKVYAQILEWDKNGRKRK